jgi:hypothetical protein
MSISSTDVEGVMPQKETAQTTCVIYDPADGSIVLMHTVVRLRGAAPGAPGADETDARSILARRNEDRREFLALHVNADDVQPGFKYRVSRGKLTAENPSRRPARSDAPQTVRRTRRRETRRR